MNKNKKTVREISLNILESVVKKQSYSNLQLNKEIVKNNLSARDAALLTEITYGTIQREMTLDFYLQPFVKKKLQDWVRQLLRLTIYQIVYLDKVPDHAAIYEAVEIAKKRGHKGVANLVNGVLRSIQREGFLSFENIEDCIERLAIETSHPKWLVSSWIEEYGYEKTKEMCKANLVAPIQTARVNLTKTTRDDCLQMLINEGYVVEKSNLVKEGIRCLKGNLAYSTCYKKGYLTIQDESSMLVTYALKPEKNNDVLDACAAPGGKTTHIAEKLNNTGNVVSLDIHEHKIKLISSQANRLQLTNINPRVMDSRQVCAHFNEQSFDRILLDAPCSGFGVIRRKPELKYRKTEEDILKLQQIQLDLLEQVGLLLKDNGLLVYSTCTVNRTENNDVITTFLQKNKQFELDHTLNQRMPEDVQSRVENGQIQIFPNDFNTDGFFIACFRKKVNN